jgi:hypothetical protein
LTPSAFSAEKTLPETARARSALLITVEILLIFICFVSPLATLSGNQSVVE